MRRELSELAPQRDPPTSGRVFRPGDDAVVRFRFVEDHRNQFEVTRMCPLVEVPPATFSAWLTHVLSVRERAEEVLTEQISETYEAQRRT